MSLDAWTFKRLILDHTGFIYSVCSRVGFRGEDLRDAVHDVWAELWADRASWPVNGPDSELAWLRTQAFRTARDKKRALDETKKRGKDFKTVPMDRADGRDPANYRDGAAFRVVVDYEGSFDRALIDHAIRVVASTLSMESEAVILARVDGGPSYSKHETQRAFRNFRRALDLPISSPRDAGVHDAATHLIQAAQRIELDAAFHLDDVDITQEIPCDIDLPPMNSLVSATSPKTDEPQRHGRPAPSPTASPRILVSESVKRIPSSPASVRTPSSRSTPPPNASARSRRPAFSASTSPAPTTPASRGAMRRMEPSAVTTRTKALDEDSSISGTAG